MKRCLGILWFMLLAPSFTNVAHAGGPSTVEGALDEADKRLDNGGNASDISTKLHKTRGLSKDEMRRLELIDARDGLIEGNYKNAEKTLAKFHKATPEDPRVSEWYARALVGNEKGDTALPLLKELATKDALHDGDSYWELAQLEKTSEPKLAVEHARAALTHPIVLQSDALEKEIKTFIGSDGKK